MIEEKSSYRIKSFSYVIVSAYHVTKLYGFLLIVKGFQFLIVNRRNYYFPIQQ
jgi:hypothetical protein